MAFVAPNGLNIFILLGILNMSARMLPIKPADKYQYLVNFV